MTDDQRLRLERGFDGESPGAEPPRSPEEARYLGQLAALRRLAVRHDPGAAVGPVRISIKPRHSPIPRWLVAATLAGLAVGLTWLARPREPVPVVVATKPKLPVSRPAVFEPRPIRNLEVDICRWANMPTTSPDRAARLLLIPKPADSRRRTAAVEVLALELANAESGSEGKVRRFAVSRRPGTRP